MRYATIAALLTSLGLGGAAWWQYARAEALTHENAVLKAQNETCSKRIKNIMEAQADAEEVDSWTDLFTVPDGWVMPEAGTGD